MYTCHEHYPCHSKTSKIYISRNIILVFPNITSTRLINIIRAIFIYLYFKFDLSEYCSYPVCIFRCNFSFSELCIFWVAKSQWNLLLIYLSWDDLWLALFQNYVWHLHPSSQMAAITKWYKKRIIWCLRYMCSNFFFKHGILKTRWACQGSWEHLVLWIINTCTLRNHWRHMNFILYTH